MTVKSKINSISLFVIVICIFTMAFLLFDFKSKSVKYSASQESRVLAEKFKEPDSQGDSWEGVKITDFNEGKNRRFFMWS